MFFCIYQLYVYHFSTYVTREDNDLEIQASTFGLEHEFADITWLPAQHKAVYRIDNRVPATTYGNGTYDYPGMRYTPRALLESTRILEEIHESNGCNELRCITAKGLVTDAVQSAFGFTNDGISFTGYPIIGYQNKMQSSGECFDSQNNLVDGYCGWDPRINGQFYVSNGFTLPMSKVKSFIQDIKKLVKMEPTSLCGLEGYMGILMRYVKASSAYLGKDDDGIEFDITYYRSRDALGPRLNEDIIDEIEQLAIFKYGGVPHWGKNRNIAFEGVINKYKDGQKFMEVKERYDPLGLFSSDWTDQVLGLKASTYGIGCAREGLCICDTDDDCGHGYNCSIGRVYAEAKVCKRKKSTLIFKNCMIDFMNL